MPNAPHQTTPFRRPVSGGAIDNPHDPADMGTAFGLEMCLEDQKVEGASAPFIPRETPPDRPLCP